MSYQLEKTFFFFFFHLRKLTGFQFISVVSVVNISLFDINAVSLSKDPQTPESMTILCKIHVKVKLTTDHEVWNSFKLSIESDPELLSGFQVL